MLTPAQLNMALANQGAAKAELMKLKAERNLIDFVPIVWDVLEPGRPFVRGWAIDAIAEHLQAVFNGEIKDLLMNVPPGFMKSLMTGVMFPAWVWGPMNRPDLRFLSSSYSKSITVRDNRKSKMVMESPQYQMHWGDRFKLDTDQQAKERYDNDHQGFRIAVSVGGGTTGERGDFFIIDDPHNVLQAESEADINEKLFWFSEVVPSRINEMMLSHFIVIMQRVAENDVSGHILAQELGYTHLNIPMEYEPDRKCFTHLTGMDKQWDEAFWQDPRTVDGELAFPERFPFEGVEALKKQLSSWGGDYAIAGQLQQRPAPRGGGLIKKDKIIRIPRHQLPKMTKMVRGWDLAGSTAKRSPWTVGTLLGECAQGFTYILHEFRIKDDAAVVKHKILGNNDELGQVARDPVTVWQEFPQDPGQAGKAQKRDWSAHPELKRRGFSFSLESGAKETRAQPFASQVDAGMVYIVDEPWATPCLNELGDFPRGTFKDRADSIAKGYNRMGMMERSEDVACTGLILID